MYIPKTVLADEIIKFDKELQAIIRTNKKVEECNDDELRSLINQLYLCISPKLQAELAYLEKYPDLLPLARKVYPNQPKKQIAYKIALENIAMQQNIK